MQQLCKMPLVRFGLFRWSDCLRSTFFSTDNLAKSDFPGEILSHGKLSPCPSQRRHKGLLLCGSASPAGLKDASTQPHVLEPHQACGTSSRPRIFKASPPNSAGCLIQRLSHREPRCVRLRQEPSGACRDRSGPGYALLLSISCSVLLRFWVFSPSQGWE